MSGISSAFQSVSTHRDVVPAYYAPRAGVFIITGVGTTNGGAVIVEEAGQIVRACASKRDALAVVNNN